MAPRTFRRLKGALQLVPLALQAGHLCSQAGGALVDVVGSQRQGSIFLFEVCNAGLCRLPCRLLLHQLSKRSVAVGAGLPRLCLSRVSSRLCCAARRGIAARLALQLQRVCSRGQETGVEGQAMVEGQPAQVGCSWRASPEPEGLPSRSAHHAVHPGLRHSAGQCPPASCALRLGAWPA